MNLDDLETIATLDASDMLSEIDALPAQLQNAWDAGQGQTLPTFSGIQQIVVAGLGGSAIGADLLAAYIEPLCQVPLYVHRDYGLPAWARGAHTLVIASSHSGNTEETLSAFEAALANGCSTLAIATGGNLAQAAGQAGVTTWRFEHAGQPRAAVGFSFGLLLAVLARLGLIPDPANDLQAAIQAMRDQQSAINAGIPAAQNPAKRLAGQLFGRWVTVFGSGLLSPVARRWKTQINELAKAWAQFEFIPEANHNTLASGLFPEDLLARLMALFLRCPSDHPRNRRRLDLTRQAFMVEGLNTDFVDASGSNRLAHQWTSLLLGDYVAYYLAIAYQVDPTPVDALENFKRAMRSGPEN